MIGRKHTKPQRTHGLDFEQIKDYKVQIELTGEVVSVLQNLMVVAIETGKVPELVKLTSLESLKETFSLISKTTMRMLATQGIDTELDKRKFSELI